MSKGSTIISLSYGEDRTFLLNRMIRKIGNKIHSIQLKPGNIVLMSKASQYIWQHSVPKDSRVSGTLLLSTQGFQPSMSMYTPLKLKI